jgi:hypothetical protein
VLFGCNFSHSPNDHNFVALFSPGAMSLASRRVSPFRDVQFTKKVRSMIPTVIMCESGCQNLTISRKNVFMNHGRSLSCSKSNSKHR